ncbi:MAG: hypothetical protein HQM02_06410 [Magnetococcales bacterium]|nr:hypothetical protein [Magnetococcales bacterium]
MGWIWRQAGLLSGFFLGLYALSWLVTAWLYPLDSVWERLDENLATTEGYMRAVDTHARPPLEYTVYPRALMGREKKVLLLGGSNVRYTFDRRESSSALSGYTLYNLGLPHSNISQLYRVAAYYEAIFPPHPVPETVFVLGITFNTMFPDRIYWKNMIRPAIDSEQLRYFWFTERDGAVKPALPMARLPALITLLHPGIVVNHVYRNRVKKFVAERAGALEDWFTGQKSTPAPTPDAEELNRMVWDDQKSRAAVKNFFRGKDELEGNLYDEQFNLLGLMIRQLAEKGHQIVLLDLPLPRWFKELSPHVWLYKLKLRLFLEEMATVSQMKWIHLPEDGIQDEDFVDTLHVKPRAIRSWSRQLAPLLAQQIDHGPVGQNGKLSDLRGVSRESTSEPGEIRRSHHQTVRQ